MESNPFESKDIADEWISFVETHNRIRYEEEVGKRTSAWSQTDLDDESVVIDVGCGQGFCSEFISQKYIGIEPSQHLINRAKELFGHCGDRFFVQGSAEKIPLPNNSADAMISTNVYVHVENLSYAFFELARVLKNNSYFFMITLNPEALQMWEALYYNKIEDNESFMIGDIDTPFTLHKNVFFKHSIAEYEKAFKINGFSVTKKEDFLLHPVYKMHLYTGFLGRLTK